MEAFPSLPEERALDWMRLEAELTRFALALNHAAWDYEVEDDPGSFKDYRN